MITIKETKSGLLITRDTLVIELAASAVPTALGPLIAELACGVPWNAPRLAPAQPSDFAAFALAWDAACAVAGNPEA